jgi:hypothetical protein
MLRETARIARLSHSSVRSTNPEQLSHVTSGVERFVLDLRGCAAGMILTNGIEVRFATYLSDEVLTWVRTGDRITAYGEVVRSTTVMSAVVIETMDGRRIVDVGPPEANGKVSPYGQPHAVLRR